MVSFNQQMKKRKGFRIGTQSVIMLALFCLVGIYIAGSIVIFSGVVSISESSTTSSSQRIATKAEERQLRAERVNRPNRPQIIQVVLDETVWEHKHDGDYNPDAERSCAYESLEEVPMHELVPRKGERHMVDPPTGGKVSLVCCKTTVGPLNILAHHKWAPKGAERFMEMVTSGYFNTGVPFMRCIKGFMCQFGLNADKSKSKEFTKGIADDPNWLPEGKDFRQNENGVKRFAQGYLAYAAYRKDSRSRQFVLSLEADGPLGGGSPWEVPWGELVHPESFETLSKIYTGYGENGPYEGYLGQRGMTPEMRIEFSKLDYINSCRLVAEVYLPETKPGGEEIDEDQKAQPKQPEITANKEKQAQSEGKQGREKQEGLQPKKLERGGVEVEENKNAAMQLQKRAAKEHQDSKVQEDAATI